MARLRLRALLRRGQLETDLQDEMAFHIAMREEQLRNEGRADARAAARLRFGNAARLQEDTRAMWTFARVEEIWSDVRIGLRLIAKRRWTMLAVVLSLAVGLGATASVFSLFDAVLFRPLPVPETDRVVRILPFIQSREGPVFVSNADFEDLRARTRSFEGITTFSPFQMPWVITQTGGQPQSVLTVLVSGEFFSTLRIQPVIGRAFRPAEDQVPGQDAVALISHRFWEREYGSDPDAVGRTFRIGSRDFVIVGVVPPNFDSMNPGAQPEIYLPRMMETLFGNGGSLTDRAGRRLQLLARLKPGVTIDQASDEVAGIAMQIAEENPENSRGLKMAVVGQMGFKMATQPDVFFIAGMLFIIVGLVLGIACVNVASLLLSTAPARIRDMAMRVALGASRWRLVRQMLIESFLVALAGIAAGLAFAFVVARWLAVTLASTGTQFDIRVDTRVVLFALAAGIASGVLSGLVPALYCSRNNLESLMRSGSARVTPLGRMWVQRGFVVLQVMTAVMVLLISGFSLEQLRILSTVDPGFQVDNVLRVALRPDTQNAVESTATLHQQILDRIRTLPGVRAAAAVYPEPLNPARETRDFVIPGFAMDAAQVSILTETARVTEGFFAAAGIPLIRGRGFDIHDAVNRNVAIINETMAKQYWPDGNPVGSRLQMGLADSAVDLEIVGIAADSKYKVLTEAPAPFVYLPMPPGAGRLEAVMLVAMEGNALEVTPQMRRAVFEIDPSLGVDVSTMEQIVRVQALAGDAFGAKVLSGIAVAGLLLSVLGLYGVISCSVSRRTQEIGVRMAMGATNRGVLLMIVLEGAKLSAIGIGLALIVCGWLRPLLDVFIRSGSLSTPAPYTTLVYTVVILGTLALTSLACYVPARRASMVDPNIALRSE